LNQDNQALPKRRKKSRKSAEQKIGMRGGKKDDKMGIFMLISNLWSKI